VNAVVVVVVHVIADQPYPSESGFFDTIAPGGTLDNRPLESIIFLRYDPDRTQYMPDGYFLLRVVIDHWADPRARGERLRRKWKSQGLLWIEPIEAPAVKIRIDGKVKPGRCVGRVD
jgi:hypothetical protein